MAVTFQHAMLDNGLTIIGEVDPLAHTSACGFFVKTGARDESSTVMGVSHFLEHMMFKGTPTRTAEAINREFDAMGARANAYTSAEMTVFYAGVLPEFVDPALTLLADMMRPALREEDFATEKGVILEEIAMYDDDPTWVLYERALETHYGEHPLSHRVLGTKQTIADLTAAQMREYFQRRYSADNTVLSVSGRVDFDAVVERVRALCGHWQPTLAGRLHTHPGLEGRRLDARDAKVSRAYRMLLTEGPGAADDSRYAAYMLALLLGGPDNSRLHWSLIETGLAEEADASYDPKDGIGDLRLFVACEPERLDEVWSIVEREVQSLPDRITAADVERARAKIATGVTLAGERPEGRMQRLGRQWLTLGRYSTLEAELEKISAVGVHEIAALARATRWDRSTLATLSPAAR